VNVTEVNLETGCICLDLGIIICVLKLALENLKQKCMLILWDKCC